ncbi:small ribosomal subunit protein uS3x-like [Miscanthus floridulus]|uniref:small ribosomal subunit protein uS3x-like n=1 Tax=Miscanthus floridulus TaxID=154761 RepID=UPI0034580B2E
MATQFSKKKKFVSDGVFYAELNEMLMRELAEDGYFGVEVRVTPMRTEIIIHATRTQNVLGEKGRRIRELTSVFQKRFNFPENGVKLYAEKVVNRGLCAIAQAESLRYKLLGGLAVRRSEGLPMLHPRVPPQLSRLRSATMSYHLVVISQDVRYACRDKDALA